MSWGHINQHGADGEPYFSLEEPEFSVRDGFVTVVQQFSHGIFFNMKDETLPLVTNSLQAIGSNTFRYARNVWPSFIGNYELAARVDGEKLAGTPMEINVYESNVRYDELYHELMEIKGLAEANGRYFDVQSFGKSTDGRDQWYAVVSDSAESVESFKKMNAQAQSDPEAVLEAAIEEGHKALDNTINQNPVLKKAGVVDAGGKGFLVILQGMLDELRGLPMPEMASEEEKAPADKAEFGAFSTEEIKFGYCTEFICSRDNKKDPELLRGFCSNLGDSLVLVDDDDIIKVHVHTNDPGLVLQEALTYGALLKVKIENMREQHTEILEEAAQSQQPAAPVKAAPEKKFGYVAVCAGAGLEAVFRDLGVDGLVGGGQTMNPSTEDILKEIDATPAEIVFVLPNNKNIIMAAQQCASMCEDKKVVIIPTKTVPQGIAAMLAVDPDASEEDNTSAMTEAFSKVRTSEITYAARDSDFGGFAIKQGDYLALEEGQLFGTDRELDTLLDRLAHSDSHQQAEFISIFYGQDVTEEQAQQAEKLFAAACPNAEVSLLPGGQPVYYYMISAE